MARSKEVFWWSLFSAGGALSALFLPAIVAVTGLAVPHMAGNEHAIRHDVHQTLVWWPVRLVFLGVIGLSFFHCAHRMRHTAMDLGLRHASTALGVLFYGGAIAGCIAAACVLRTW
ncbi:MAG: fumarate reductase subunit D [Planctomycetes bacterium]|nr:fumarate reductase subunit D [Planctomycetota bacterium]